jgi:predicted dehydrogenase
LIIHLIIQVVRTQRIELQYSPETISARLVTLHSPDEHLQQEHPLTQIDNKIKIAVIGVGVMGSQHVKDIDQLENTKLAAICDIDQARAGRYAHQYDVPAFNDHRQMLDSIELEAILIATPHYDHPPISIEAFERGIHVLTEKPIGVHVKAANEMIAAYQAARKIHPNLVFAVMFQQRTYGFWRKIKNLIEEGELGRLVRTTWIITDWFRTQSYYDNGGWRATWKGEGWGRVIEPVPAQPGPVPVVRGHAAKGGRFCFHRQVP